MIRSIFIFALALGCGLSAADQRSLTSSGITGSWPDAAPFNAIGTLRIETRLHTMPTASSATRRNILILPGGFQLRIVENTTIIQADSPVGISNITAAYFEQDNPPANVDIVVRWQLRRLTSTTARVQLVVWDETGRVVDFKEHTAPQTTSGSTFSIAGATSYLGTGSGGAQPCDCKIAWLRMYSTPAEVGDFPANKAGGDIADWEFADSLTSEAGGYAWSGSATYSDTPKRLNLPFHRSGRAGQPIQVDLRPSDGSGYALKFVSATTIVPPIIRSTGTDGVFLLDNTVSANYRLQATATLAGTAVSQEISVGAINKNSSGVVIPPGPEARRVMLGYLRALDDVELPRYRWERAVSSHAYGGSLAAQIARDFGTFTAGTLTLTNGSTAVTGSGTSLNSIFVCSGTSEYLLVRYTAADGDGTGFAQLAVAQVGCTGTTLTLSQAWTGVTQSGVQFLRWDDTTSLRWAGDGSINYYDAVLAHYQTCYATQDSRFCEYARTLADAWWQAPRFNEGRTVESIGTSHSAPRQTAVVGLALWCLDLQDQGDTAKAEAIAKWLTRHLDLTFYLYVTNSSPTARPSWFGVGSVREAGYSYAAATALAYIGPTLTGTVNTSGTSITWVSGDKFPEYNMSAGTLYIAGQPYTVSSANATSATVTAGAGSQSGVTYTYSTTAAWRQLINTYMTEYWLNWQCKPANPSPRCSDSWSTGAYRGTDAAWTGNGSLPFHSSLAFGDLLPRLFMASWFTETATLDTVIAAHAAWYKDGVAKTDGGAGPKVFNEEIGFLGLPCRADHYWVYTTPNASGSDSDGNTGGDCSTKDLMENDRTRNNENTGYVAWWRSGVTAYRDLGDKQFSSAFGGDSGLLADGVRGYGLRTPINSERITLQYLSNNGYLKQFAQAARGSLQHMAFRAADMPATATATLNVVLAGTGADRVLWRLSTGETGTCTSMPCSITGPMRSKPLVQYELRTATALVAKSDWHSAGWE